MKNSQIRCGRPKTNPVHLLRSIAVHSHIVESQMTKKAYKTRPTNYELSNQTIKIRDRKPIKPESFSRWERAKAGISLPMARRLDQIWSGSGLCCRSGRMDVVGR